MFQVLSARLYIAFFKAGTILSKQYTGNYFKKILFGKKNIFAFISIFVLSL